MKPLIPFALLTAVSFTALAGHFAPDSEALACGDYRALAPKLSAAEIDLTVSLLEKQVPDRLTTLGREQRERRVFSRARIRPETTTGVVVMSYEAPTVGDPFPSKTSKMVSGRLTIAAPNVARLTTRYRVDVLGKTVQILNDGAWVAAAEWTRVPQRTAGKAGKKR